MASSSAAGGAARAAAPNAHFDAEGRRLQAVLKEKFSTLNAIYTHPTTGASIYVGSQSAAESVATLEGHGITHIVNCTDSIPQFHEKNAKFSYYRYVTFIHSFIWFELASIFQAPQYSWTLFSFEFGVVVAMMGIVVGMSFSGSCNRAFVYLCLPLTWLCMAMMFWQV